MLLTLLPMGKPHGISGRFVVNRLIVFRNVFRVRTQATLQSTFATHLAGISPWARRRSASRLIKPNNMDLLISLPLPSVYNRLCAVFPDIYSFIFNIEELRNWRVVALFTVLKRSLRQKKIQFFFYIF